MLVANPETVDTILSSYYAKAVTMVNFRLGESLYSTTTLREERALKSSFYSPTREASGRGTDLKSDKSKTSNSNAKLKEKNLLTVF